jgi:hypothetical protein
MKADRPSISESVVPMKPEDEQRILRVLNKPIRKHMSRFFDFTQSRTDGVITAAVMTRLYANFLKNVEQPVTYKQRDTSSPIDCVLSKFVRNRLIVAGSPFVLKKSIKKVIGVENSKGELVPLRDKDIKRCDSMDVPYMSVSESEEFVGQSSYS